MKQLIYLSILSFSFISANAAVGTGLDFAQRCNPCIGPTGPTGIPGPSGLDGGIGATGATGGTGAPGIPGDPLVIPPPCFYNIDYGTIALPIMGSVVGAGVGYTYVATPSSLELTFLPPFTGNVTVTATAEGVLVPTVSNLTRIGPVVTINLTTPAGASTTAEAINFIAMECI